MYTTKLYPKSKALISKVALDTPSPHLWPLRLAASYCQHHQEIWNKQKAHYLQPLKIAHHAWKCGLRTFIATTHWLMACYGLLMVQTLSTMIHPSSPRSISTIQWIQGLDLWYQRKLNTYWKNKKTQQNKNTKNTSVVIPLQYSEKTKTQVFAHFSTIS